MAQELGAPIVGSANLAEETDLLASLALEDFNPSQQTAFPVVQLNGVDLGLDYGPINGSFQALVLQGPQINTGILGTNFLAKPPGTDLSYVETDMREYLAWRAFPVLPADFNEDGFVDRPDLDRWQAGYGTATGADHFQGDADGDGDADGSDFLTWQRQLGSAGSSVPASVPEPTAAVILALAAVIVVSAGRAARKID
jgi:hypothetical protein